MKPYPFSAIVGHDQLRLALLLCAVRPEIGGALIRLAEPLAVDSYATDRHTGGFLVIDAADGNTLAAGLVGSRDAA